MSTEGARGEWGHPPIPVQAAGGLKASGYLN
jgi:hypothetical protein